MITEQPQGGTYEAGETLNLKVALELEGSFVEEEDLTYQWFNDGEPLDLELLPSLTIENLTPEDAGKYYVEIYRESVEGVVRSNEAEVKVSGGGANPYLSLRNNRKGERFGKGISLLWKWD